MVGAHKGRGEQAKGSGDETRGKNNSYNNIGAINGHFVDCRLRQEVNQREDAKIRDLNSCARGNQGVEVGKEPR